MSPVVTPSFHWLSARRGNFPLKNQWYQWEKTCSWEKKGQPSCFAETKTGIMASYGLCLGGGSSVAGNEIWFVGGWSQQRGTLSMARRRDQGWPGTQLRTLDLCQFGEAPEIQQIPTEYYVFTLGKQPWQVGKSQSPPASIFFRQVAVFNVDTCLGNAVRAVIWAPCITLAEILSMV